MDQVIRTRTNILLTRVDTQRVRTLMCNWYTMAWHMLSNKTTARRPRDMSRAARRTMLGIRVLPVLNQGDAVRAEPHSTRG
jgi:hypothetical protein